MNTIKQAEEKVIRQVNRLKGWRTYLILLGNLSVVVVIFIRLWNDGSIRWLIEFCKEYTSLMMVGTTMYTTILTTWKIRTPHPMKHESNKNVHKD